jgi:hypothetical protein
LWEGCFEESVKLCQNLLMSRRRQSSRRESASGSVADRATAAGSKYAVGDDDATWLTGVVAVLMLTRYFLPAESAALGETLWIVQFWLMSAVVWFWWSARRGNPRRSFDAFDCAVGLLVGGHMVSAGAVLLTEGDRRAALNMLWEWIGIGVATLMIREVLQRGAGRGRLLTLVVLAAITLAGLGLWQHHVWYPQLSAKLAEFDRLRTTAPADPQGAVDRERRLRELSSELGPLMAGGDATSNQLLRARVAASTEPIGRFALANTFAGLLLVGLLLGLGQLMCATGSASASRAENVTGDRTGEAIGTRPLRLLGVEGWRWWSGAILMAGTAYCFWLAKSRTALIGLLVGLAAWAVLSRRSGTWSRSLLWGAGAMIAGGLLIVLPVIASLAGGLDREVLTEAPKSLQFRLEYWTATGRVIRESPVLGVGPGNFRQAYLAHKLPGSSEEVLDPHNLLLDVWANGGVLALAGLLWLIALSVRALWRRDRCERTGEAVRREDQAAAPPARSIVWDVAVGGGALLVAAFVSLMNGSGFLLELWWLVAGWCAASLLWPTRMRLTTPITAAASCALVVHLMGAGGIAMPAILQTLILLSACLAAPAASGVVEPPRAQWSALPPPLPWRPMLGAALCLSLAVACAFTATLPVSAARTQVAVAQSILAEGGRPEEAIRTLQSAAEADPLSAAAWQELALAYASAWRRHARGDEQTFERAVQAQQEAIHLDPRRAGGWQMLGDLWWLRYELLADATSAEQARAAYAQAAERYPHLATLQGKLAQAARASGESTLAQQSAQRALELETANRRAGHVDKYLPETMRERVEEIARDEVEEIGDR